ncbi:MAG TPA: hypothetical protein VKY15_05295 [Acidimicrobiales bacterium]|nr:hypothetical protein [Acidimicrobiales bacterium]
MTDTEAPGGVEVSGDREGPASLEELLDRLVEMVSSAKSMPLSASVLISRDEALELLEAARRRLPEELKQARWMLREREEFLAKTRHEADHILEAARAQAERMVERTEISRQAQHNAQRTIDAAREEAMRLRHEAEDYCDQKLAAFEIVLERTQKLVQAGREKLQGIPAADNGPKRGRPSASLGGARPGPEQEASSREEAFFDQDRP